jgi:integrase
MYKWACAEDIKILDKNPVLNFKAPKAPQESCDIVVISRDEVPIILNCLKRDNSLYEPKWDLYAEFMLQTGMRTGEVRALRWKDIDGNKILVHSNWTLTHGYKNSTKTNKQRWVPLNNKCNDILKEIKQEDEFIFPWNRSTFQKFFRARVNREFDAGNLKFRYRPYDLRHTTISRWLEAGIPVTQVAKWAGNTNEVIWAHYANTTTDYEMPVL